ncbi:hypothetical protein C0993_003245, partial [Termitomyces sp. T159_Od127]
PDALTRRPDVYPKKSFEAERNAFNHRVVIPPEHLHAVLIMNEEGILHQIHNAPWDAFFTQHDPQNTSADEINNDHPFTLSPDN